MTRRMLDSAIFQNEKFGVMPPMARLLAIGVINQADDQGRGKAHPVYLRSQIFPYDDVTPAQVSTWLTLIAQNETVILYSADSKDYYQVVNWWKYQSHQYAMPSQFPKPPGWRDRIRKSLTKGLIVTCNWLTTDGKQSPDTCDEQGLAIHLNEQVNDDLNIQVYVKDKVEVQVQDQVQENERPAPDNSPTTPSTPATNPPQSKPSAKQKQKPELAPTDQRAVFGAIAEICDMDSDALTNVVKAQIGGAAKQLIAAGATADRLTQFRQWWDRTDWRGKKHQAPTPPQIVVEWPKFSANGHKTGNVALDMLKREEGTTWQPG